MSPRIVFCVALAVLALPHPAVACGYTPWSEDAETPEAALQALMTSDTLPLLSPGWHSEYWVIAWARLAGKTFSQSEVDALSRGPWLDPQAALGPALALWASARQQVSDAGPMNVEPQRRGENYTYQLVCGPDGFSTAAETLSARVHTQSPAAARRWLSAQDLVFNACSDPTTAEPAPAPAAASALEVADRAYQRAVWAEHTAHGEAHRRYEAIAASSSPWADIARYRAARMQLASSGHPDLPAAIRMTRDAKALRALRQLQDRYELFPQGPAEAVRVLSERLVNEDLGVDLPRTLRDIVFLSKRMDSCSTVLSSLVACVTPPATHRLASLRRSTVVDWASDMPLLRLNAEFHRARVALAAGQRRVAARHARRMHRLARASTRSSMNAAHALLLAAGAGDGLTHLMRSLQRDGDAGEIHADGRAWLAAGTIREWEALAQAQPQLAPRVAEYAFVRSVLLGNWGRATRFARRVSQDETDIGAALRLALIEPSAQRRGLFLLAIAQHEPTELSVTQAFGSHYGTTQVAGCDWGHCMDAHPHQSAYAPRILRRPSAERRRLGASRIDDLGEAIMAFVARDADSLLIPELLHRFVGLTRRASVHRSTSTQTGVLSHAAFDYLHSHHEGDPWTLRTRHWYR